MMKLGQKFNDRERVLGRKKKMKFRNDSESLSLLCVFVFGVREHKKLGRIRRFWLKEKWEKFEFYDSAIKSLKIIQICLLLNFRINFGRANKGGDLMCVVSGFINKANYHHHHQWKWNFRMNPVAYAHVVSGAGAIFRKEFSTTTHSTWLDFSWLRFLIFPPFLRDYKSTLWDLIWYWIGVMPTVLMLGIFVDLWIFFKFLLKMSIKCLPTRATPNNIHKTRWFRLHLNQWLMTAFSNDYLCITLSHSLTLSLLMNCENG